MERDHAGIGLRHHVVSHGDTVAGQRAHRVQNARKVRVICRSLVESGDLPIAPHLYLPAFLDEKTERDLALVLCLEIIAVCDELRVYGGTVTAGMRREIDRAEALGIPVRFVEVAS